MLIQNKCDCTFAISTVSHIMVAYLGNTIYSILFLKCAFLQFSPRKCNLQEVVMFMHIQTNSCKATFP